MEYSVKIGRHLGLPERDLRTLEMGTLVHDDSVDHSALRRGMPTVNSVFSHQVSVLMGDYLYTRALREMVRSGNVEALRVLTKRARPEVINRRTTGQGVGNI